MPIATVFEVSISSWNTPSTRKIGSIPNIFPIQPGLLIGVVWEVSPIRLASTQSPLQNSIHTEVPYTSHMTYPMISCNQVVQKKQKQLFGAETLCIPPIDDQCPSRSSSIAHGHQQLLETVTEALGATVHHEAQATTGEAYRVEGEDGHFASAVDVRNPAVVDR